MNLTGYDALALGPKELSLGLDTLRQRMAEADFPLLSANVVLTGTDELVAEPYAVREVGGFCLGIIGLTRVPDKAKPGFEVGDPQAALARFLPELTERADTIVLLTNLNFRQGRALVQAVPGVDLLVAALPGQLPQQALRVADTGTLAVTAEQPLLRHTGRRVGKLVVTLGNGGTLSGESWQSISLDDRFVDDLEMQLLLDKYRP